MIDARILAAALAFGLGLAATTAEGTAQRTFVASTGNDADACSIAAPCRSFARALSETNVGGEVIVQDSAGYGAFTIDRSVSIVSPPGIYAGVSVFAPFAGITVDAPGVKVLLSGLTVNGQGGGVGIWFKQGAELLVERCTVSGVPKGILSEVGAITLRDTVVRGSSQAGIAIDSGTVAAHVDGVRVHGNSVGMRVDAFYSSVRASIRNSVATESANAGILVTASNNSLAVVDIESSEVTGNGFGGVESGIYLVVSDATGKAEVTVARSLVSRNRSAGIFAYQMSGVLHLSVTDSTITGNYGQGINGFGATVIASNNTVTRNGLEGLRSNGGATFFSRVNNNVQSNFGGDTSGTITTLVPK